MKPPHTRPTSRLKTRLASALGAGVLMVVPARAATIIDWQGDYVASTQNLVLGTATDVGTSRTYQYSTSSAKSPSSGYNGTVFYGALMIQQDGGPVNFNQTQLVQNAAGDRITIGSPNTADVNKLIRGLIFFQKSDFAALSGAPNITFDSSSAITIVNGGSSGTITLRAAVLNGSQWYLSQTAATTFSGNVTITNASTANWGAWDPTGTTIADDPTTYATLGSTFTDIQGVGYFFESSRFGSIANSSIAQVTFTAVSEPATWALLGVGLSAFTIFRRRSRVG